MNKTSRPILCIQRAVFFIAPRQNEDGEYQQ